MTTTTYPTLSLAVGGGKRGALRSILLALAGSALLWTSAKVQIPFYPVPMTMQTFVVLFLGFVLGPRLGAATVLLYLAEGLVGLPVFAGTPEKGLGLAYMAGPTGGYLVGFVISAYIVGWCAERGFDRRLVPAALSALVGLIVLYVAGLAWLGFVVGWDKPVLAWGLYPFLPGEGLKLALLAATLPLVWRGIVRR
ncbi:biotin transporter BioY [Pelagibius marinus]|uniref:biotin transporter BioY n=1 Tax=Pelagibius marinus TaxID=2762760 RepID=UPI0018730202|nr:biotin transporter BioY [Pelagibius marinus]